MIPEEEDSIDGDQQPPMLASAKPPAPTKPPVSAKAPNALWQQSASFKAHSLTVMTAIDKAFGMLDDLENLVPVLASLGKRHKGYGAVAEHYDWVGMALVSTLQTALGSDIMTEDVTQAYVITYTVVKHVMLDGAGLLDPTTSMPALPTAEHVDAIAGTWGAVKATAGLQEAGQLFFKILFAQHPAALGLFSRFRHHEDTPPPSSGKFTGNMSLLVIPRPVLTDCLRFQRRKTASMATSNLPSLPARSRPRRRRAQRRKTASMATRMNSGKARSGCGGTRRLTQWSLTWTRIQMTWSCSWSRSRQYNINRCRTSRLPIALSLDRLRCRVRWAGGGV